MTRLGGSRALPTAVAVGIAIAVACASSAHGTARVRLENNPVTLRVAVDSILGPDGNHGLEIETIPGHSFRVKQDQLGRPAIVSSQLSCDTNSFFNDVVCNDLVRGSIDVEMGDGADLVQLNEAEANLFDPSPCNVGVTLVPAEVTLGAGNDVVEVFDLADSGANAGCFGLRDMAIPLTAVGGSGDDSLLGGPHDDVLVGGSDRDTLRGDSGVDRLQGGPASDVLDGGPGTNDTATYEEKTEPVTVAIDGGVNDGVAGERDNVEFSVENLVGGPEGDTLVGSLGPNRLAGGPGGDTLRGEEENDHLRGQAGSDKLDGQAGLDQMFGAEDADLLEDGGSEQDVFDGGSGGDVLDARDGVADVIACGDGADLLSSDLFDPSPRDCEAVKRFALDDGPPAQATAQRLRPGAGGRMLVRVACPRGARVRCRGALALRDARSGRSLARGRYRLALGETAAVRLRARGRLPRRVVAATREQGASAKGPRSSTRVLRVARSA